MDQIFSGVPTNNIESWFSNLIVYDVTMPHTKNRLSPITFSEFLARSSILCTNQEQVYEAANKYWRKYLSFTADMLAQVQGAKDMNLCEVEHPGWSTLIDYFNRILDVQKFDGNPCYQMHYLAHVFYLFYQESFENHEEQCCQRTIFNEIISPILYTPCIPITKYFWMPVLNYLDLRFRERIVDLCAKVSAFIETHCGRTMDQKAYDISHLNALVDIVKEGLTGVHENKYNDELWKVPFLRCLTQATVIKADLDACELHDSFEQNGMKCCKPIHQLQNMRQKFERNHLDDPDIAIDSLLDAYTSIRDGLKSYNIPNEEVKS